MPLLFNVTNIFVTNCIKKNILTVSLPLVHIFSPLFIIIFDKKVCCVAHMYLKYSDLSDEKNFLEGIFSQDFYLWDHLKSNKLYICRE